MTHLRDLIVCLNRFYHSPHDLLYLGVMHVFDVPKSPELVINVESPDSTALKTALEILLYPRVSPITQFEVPPFDYLLTHTIH